jgi:hypothetical protein
MIRTIKRLSLFTGEYYLMRDSDPLILFLSTFLPFEVGFSGNVRRDRAELMLYTVLMSPFESVVMDLVYFGLVFCSRTTMTALSRADLTSAIHYSFLTDVPVARSLKFSAVSRCRWCRRWKGSLGDRLRRD